VSGPRNHVSGDQVREVVEITREPVRLLAWTREETCASLGNISVDTFERHVQPRIRVIRLGTRVLVDPREIEAFVRAVGEGPFK
jgi:hypothetical protein